MRRPPPRTAVRAALGLRRALLRLADRALPAEWALWEQANAIGTTHVLAALAELGVADELARGPADAATLAPRVGADADALHRVLRFAAVLGVVRLGRDGRFALTRLGRPLRADVPESVRDWARYMGRESTARAWGGLTEAVRTGRPAFRAVHGRSVWEHQALAPAEGRLFAAAMRRLTEHDLPAVVRGYPWPRTGTVCDLGGGVGTVLGGILAVRSELRGVLVETPGVLAEAEGWLAERGIRGRVDLLAGDLFGAWTVRADVYVLKDVLHDWDDAACARILAGVRRAAPAGGRVVVVERLQERNRPDPGVSWGDVQMLTQCEGGRQRSAGELLALLSAAGFGPGLVRTTSGPALVEGVAG